MTIIREVRWIGREAQNGQGTYVPGQIEKTRKIKQADVPGKLLQV